MWPTECLVTLPLQVREARVRSLLALAVAVTRVLRMTEPIKKDITRTVIIPMKKEIKRTAITSFPNLKTFKENFTCTGTSCSAG